MALTLEQKAVNREASLLRQAAHRARKAERNAEIGKIDVSALVAETEAASKATNDVIAARNNEEIAIRAKIAALQNELLQVKVKYETSIDVANSARVNAYEKLRSKESRLRNEIESRYPDLAGSAQHYINNWRAPQGYIERFASEHAEELAKKAAKRAVKKTNNEKQA